MLDLTERQEKILNTVIEEYIKTSEPVSSKSLSKKRGFNVCPATIRNELQDLTDKGYICQPHTSAGRVPTKKAYQHFAQKLADERERTFHSFIVRQIREAHEEMEREMRQMEELMDTLEDDNLFNILNILDQWHRRMLN